MPGVLIEPVDEFAMQADWSDKSHGRAILSWDAYQRAGVVNTQMFPVRTQRNGAFQGLYNLQDLFDGTWREREGYDDDQFFKADTSAFDRHGRSPNVRFEKKNPDDDRLTRRSRVRQRRATSPATPSATTCWPTPTSRR